MYRKFAWTVRSPFMVTVIGLVVPEASPLHPVKSAYVPGVAVTWTVAPGMYC
jgi:hypothetical protein